jgi:hypothetical protein
MDAAFDQPLLRQGPLNNSRWDKWFYVLPETHAN